MSNILDKKSKLGVQFWGKVKWGGNRKIKTNILRNFCTSRKKSQTFTELESKLRDQVKILKWKLKNSRLTGKILGAKVKLRHLI